jgi:hypothetical protein
MQQIISLKIIRDRSRGVISLLLPIIILFLLAIFFMAERYFLLRARHFSESIYFYSLNRAKVLTSLLNVQNNNQTDNNTTSWKIDFIGTQSYKFDEALFIGEANSGNSPLIDWDYYLRFISDCNYKECEELLKSKSDLTMKNSLELKEATCKGECNWSFLKAFKASSLTTGGSINIIASDDIQIDSLTLLNKDKHINLIIASTKGQVKLGSIINSDKFFIKIFSYKQPEIPITLPLSPIKQAPKLFSGVGGIYSGNAS